MFARQKLLPCEKLKNGLRKQGIFVQIEILMQFLNCPFLPSKAIQGNLLLDKTNVFMPGSTSKQTCTQFPQQLNSSNFLLLSFFILLATLMPKEFQLFYTFLALQIFNTYTCVFSSTFSFQNSGSLSHVFCLVLFSRKSDFNKDILFCTSTWETKQD